MTGFPQRNLLIGSQVWTGDPVEDAQASQDAFDQVSLLIQQLKRRIISLETLGDILTSSVALASVGSWAAGVAQNITSLTLTPGEWDVEGWIQFQGGAITGTYSRATISTTSATVPSDGGTLYISVPTAASAVQLTTRTTRVSVAAGATTTVYLVGDIGFSAGTPTAGGSIRATLAQAA